MKNILKKIALLFLLINLGLTIQMTVVNADETLPSGGYDPLEDITRVGDETQLPGFQIGQHTDAPPDYLQEGSGTFTSPIYFLIDFFRYLISGIAMIVIIIQAIKLVSTANEEEATKAKTTLLMGIIGLMVIQLADVIVKRMFFGEQGEAFEDAATSEIYAQESVSQIRGVIGFVQVFVGVGAVLVIIIRAFTLITSSGDEEAVTKAKQHILYALVGVAIVILSEVIVRGVVFPEAGSRLPDIGVGKYILINLTNYLSGFIAIIAFVVLFYGGYRYVVSAGNEEMNEKIKRIIYGSLIALVLSLGAFALVNTVFTIDPPV